MTKIAVRGADWAITKDGKIIMNYGGYVEPAWEPWQSKFCWLPTKIETKVIMNDKPLRPYYVTHKWIWLRTIYFRRRELSKINDTYEYEYADDLFELMKKDSD